MLLGKLQDAEQRLKSIEESRQELTSSTPTEEETVDGYRLDYPMDALGTLPFPKFLPLVPLTHLSGRWILGEEGPMGITYDNPLPWIVHRNTMMTDDHWLNRCFEGQRCPRSRRPDIAIPNQSHVTTAYAASMYNLECGWPLEAKEHDEEGGKGLKEPEDQANDTLKPSACFPNVDILKFPPRPRKKPEPI